MKRLLVAALAPFIASFLWAGQATRTETTVTKTTFNGTLVDAGCQSTHSEQKNTTTNGDQSTTTTTRTETKVECPVTTQTTTFGLLMPGGKYVRFDDPSNTRIVEIVKSNKHWHKYVSEKAPLQVHVVGTPNGDVVLLDSIK